MLTSLKMPLHPHFVLRNRFLNFFACVTLHVSPDILCPCKDEGVQPSALYSICTSGL